MKVGSLVKLKDDASLVPLPEIAPYIKNMPQHGVIYTIREIADAKGHDRKVLKNTPIAYFEEMEIGINFYGDELGVELIWLVELQPPMKISIEELLTELEPV